MYRTADIPAGRQKAPEPSAILSSLILSETLGIRELPRPSAAPESLSLWLVDVNEYPWQAHTRWLSTSELARARRFVSERHRNRYLAAHCALRDVLSRQVDVFPELLSFTVGINGKPRLAIYGHGPHHQTYFNLSHSADLVLVAISQKVDVGVDIEVRNQLTHLSQLITTNLTAQEQSETARLPPENHQTAFLRVWTRKEACLKAVGCGLSVAPHSLHVGINPSYTATSVLENDRTTTVEVQSIDIGLDAFAALAWVKAISAPG
jgi:4'-phosphopantetheinyl transferase